nr:phage tail length tape measure family protein [uncultured Acidovorax sp.]
MNGTSVGGLIVRLLLEREKFRADLRETVADAEGGAQRVTRAAGEITEAIADAAQGQANVASLAARSAGVLGVAATAAVAAGLAVGVVYHQAGKEVEAFHRNVVLTGNAAGVTAEQLQDMARRMDGVAGTQSQAAATLAQMTGTAQVVRQNLELVSTAAVEMERASVQSISESVKIFTDLGKDPVAASVRLNESLNYLTAATYDQIKAAQDLGDKERAASVAQSAYAEEMRSRAAQVTQNLGLLERSWRKVRDIAAEAWDAMLNVGRADTSEDKLAQTRARISELQAKLANGGGFGDTAGGAAVGRPNAGAQRRMEAELQALQAQEAALQGVAYASKAAADAERERAENNRLYMEWDQQGDAFKQKADKQREERAKAEAEGQRLVLAGLITEAQLRERLAAIDKKYEDKGAARSAASAITKEQSAYQGLMASIQAKVKAGEAELAQSGAVMESQRALIQLDADLAQGKVKLTAEHEKAVRAAIEELGSVERRKVALAAAQRVDEERVQIQQELSAAYVAESKAREQARQAVTAYVTQTSQAAKAVEYEISLMGLSRTAREAALEQYRIELDLKERIAQVDSNTAFDEAQREGERARLRVAAAQAVETAGQRVMLDEWKQTVDQYDQVFQRGFVDMMNAGKDGWKSFTSSLVTTFKTTVADQLYKAFAQPFVVRIVGSLLGITGLSGAGGVAQAGSSLLSSVGSIGSGYSMLAGLGGAFGGGVAGGFGGLMGSLGLSSAGSTLGGALSAGSIAMGSGNILGGLGTFVGALGPIAAGIGLLASVLGKDDSGTPHTGALAEYSAANGLRTSQEHGAFGMGFGGVDASEETRKAVGAVAQGMVKTLDGVAETFGREARYTVATAFADDSSKDGAWGGLRIAQGDNELVNWNRDRDGRWAPREYADGKEGMEQYRADLASGLRDALAEVVPDWGQTYLDALGESASLEEVEQAAASIMQLQVVWNDLGKVIPQLAGLSEEAVSAFAEAAGGMEQLTAGMASFQSNYYSDAERRAAAIKEVENQLAAVGVEMPRTREEFRALMEQAIAAGEAGAGLVAALLSVEGTFASFTPQVATLTDAFNVSADTISSILNDAIANANSAEEARQMASQAFEESIYGGLQDSLVGDLSGLLSGAINPLIDSLIGGAAASSAALAAGGAAAASSMATGGAIGASAAAQGGAAAAGALASGGSAAAGAMMGGGAAVGGVVASVLDQARAYVNAYAQILADPAIKDVIGQISGMVGDVAGIAYEGVNAGGGGGSWQSAGSPSAPAGGAEDYNKALRSIGDTIEDEIKRLRGLMVDDSPASQEVLMARFATETAKARAGDKTALEALPGLSKEIESAAQKTATSAADLALMRGWLANSLSVTLDTLGLGTAGAATSGKSAGKPGTAAPVVRAEPLPALVAMRPVLPEPLASGGTLEGVVRELAALRKDLADFVSYRKNNQPVEQSVQLQMLDALEDIDEGLSVLVSRKQVVTP